MSKSKRTTPKLDERRALTLIAVIVGELMHEAQGKYTLTRGQVLDYGDRVQAVLLQIEIDAREEK